MTPCSAKLRRSGLASVGEREPTPVTGAARECEPLELALVEGPAESRRWREQLERYHYLGCRVPFGAHPRYAQNFPDQCRYVLETLGEVYGYDAEARERGLSPEERLRFHQEHSQPLMDKLHAWLDAQFAERKTEPNSGLGKAITYLLRHWKGLTLFLREARAPLDNNLVERAHQVHGCRRGLVTGGIETRRAAPQECTVLSDP